MAKLLYRIGSGSARRPIVVLITWLLLLCAGVGAMATWSKPLSNEFKLPGSDFGKVLSHLQEQIPEVAGGNGTVVFHTEDGGRFSTEQRRAIGEVVQEWRDLGFVRDAIDPFETQQRLDSTQGRLDRAKTQVVEGRKEFEDGAYQIRRLNWLVERGRADIARLERTDPSNPTLEDRRRGQEQGEIRLADAVKQRDAAQRKLRDGERRYATAKELYGYGASARFVSESGDTALAQIRFDGEPQSMPPEQLEQVPELGDKLESAGVEVDYGQEIVHVSEPGGVGEVVGIVIAAIVLLVMLGSVALAGLPIGVAILGVGVSLSIGLSATGLVTLHQMAPILGAMLGLAVGIDYALFIVNRHRTQLADLAGERGAEDIGRDQIRHSIAMAVGTAGNAVVVAGSTVVIALAALSISGIPVLMQMGLLAAFTVAITVCVALTLTPAMLSLIGRRAVPRRRRDRKGSGTQPQPRVRFADRWVGWVTRHAVLVLVVLIAGIATLAVPALQLRLGLPDGGSEDADTTAYQAFERVEKEFGAGANGPIVVSADYAERIPEGDVNSAEIDVARTISEQPGVKAVLPIGVSKDRTTIAFQVLSEAGPSSATTVEVVDELRGEVAEELAEQDITLGVTGSTAANIEVSAKLADALPLYVVLVIGLSLLLLTMVFRSVVVPVLATAGFLLSVAGSFGAIVAVYQWGWLGEVFGVHRPGAVMSFMPTLLIGILFGLAMDYQMFLGAGMREAYAHGEPARAAVRHGFSRGAQVVTAAALIMISVFAGFVHAPMTMARPIGFGLAVGVLIDAFVVRLTITPAAMWLLGDRAWWIPGWLDRLLPDLDVEGSALLDSKPEPAPDREPEPVG